MKPDRRSPSSGRRRNPIRISNSFQIISGASGGRLLPVANRNPGSRLQKNPSATIMKTDPRIRFRTPVLLAAMLSLSGIASPARADRAENAFVVVEGDGVVRLDGKNFAVLSSGKGESLVKVTAQPGWKLDTPSSAKVSAAKPLRYKATDASHEGSGTGQISGLTATFITPAGDPVNAPVDSGEGQNEFTFSTASTGTLTIDLKVEIDPVLSDDQAPEGTFSINGIGNSAKRWADANPNGKASYSGGFYTATITFSGLPANNSDFGKKTATFSVTNVTITQGFEVFFPKNGNNHPACSSCTNCPNWFFYWRQTNAGTSASSVLYSTNMGPGGVGRTPAMVLWSNPLLYSKQEIWVGDRAALRDWRQGNRLLIVTGIDLFRNTILHENVHVKQIALADGELGSYNGQAGTIWASGWSWNDRNWNNHHYPSSVQFGQTVHLDVNNNDVPDTWEPYSIEGAAYLSETSDEHTFWQSDWGDPGKQHKTLKRFDD